MWACFLALLICMVRVVVFSRPLSTLKSKLSSKAGVVDFFTVRGTTINTGSS
jgi:hypothetical protein